MSWVISGALKDYAWGTPGGLQRWLAESDEGDAARPQAELWFGVHPNGPSTIISGGESAPTETDVPILVKLLAASEPLSIQVHPTAQFAAHGFAEQQLNGDPRPFADSGEKTEMLYALTEFKAFAGWRDFAHTRAALVALGEISPTDSRSRHTLFTDLARSHSSISMVEELNARIPDACATAKFPLADISAYRTVVERYPSDPGAILSLFLNFLTLAPGECIYVPAGVPHSYLQGTGLEVMTSSDNVLRLGLTPKPVFTDLALTALDFESSGDTIRDLSAAPFGVSVFTADETANVSANVTAESGHYRLVLALDGTSHIELDASPQNPAAPVTLSQGQALMLVAGEPTAHITSTGRVALVESRG